MSYQDIARRYKRLISMLMWACTLSPTEATCCIQMHLSGDMFAGEAVNHMGGVLACLEHATTCRDQFAHMGETETYRSILHRATYYAEIAA